MDWKAGIQAFGFDSKVRKLLRKPSTKQFRYINDLLKILNRMVKKGHVPEAPVAKVKNMK